MFLIAKLTVRTDSTGVTDIPGSSKEPGVPAGQPRDDDNQKGDNIHRYAGDENDDPLAIMW